MYGGNAYGSAPYAGGESGAVAPPAAPAFDPSRGIPLAAGILLSVEVTPVPVPARLVRTARVEKAFAYPIPVLIDGRPT